MVVVVGWVGGEGGGRAVVGGGGEGGAGAGEVVGGVVVVDGGGGSEDVCEDVEDTPASPANGSYSRPSGAGVDEREATDRLPLLPPPPPPLGVEEGKGPITGPLPWAKALAMAVLGMSN